uniref:Uncharacterized protein n=1 Tax=Pararge aegeria TaxID=116150 RepID=S4PT38_9NEOP
MDIYQITIPVMKIVITLHIHHPTTMAQFQILSALDHPILPKHKTSFKEMLAIVIQDITIKVPFAIINPTHTVYIPII